MNSSDIWEMSTVESTCPAGFSWRKGAISSVDFVFAYLFAFFQMILSNPT